MGCADRTDVLLDLMKRRDRLGEKLQEANEGIRAYISHMPLSSIVPLFGSVYAYPVWAKGGFSVVLLVNKYDKLGGCGILMWGNKFENNDACLAIKVQQFEANFMVFDGSPSSRSFAIVHSQGEYEVQKLGENLKTTCEQAGVSRVYAKNGELLQCGGKLYQMTWDIVNFYVLIARPDGTLLPEFDFINPRNSSAFWHNNG